MEVDTMTLKRAEAGALDYLANQQAAKQWLEEVIGEEIPSEDLSMELQDGVVLCKLISVVYPACAQSIRVVTSSPYEYMKINNINMFVQACRAYGLRDGELFDPQELYHKRDMPRVLRTIRNVAELAGSKGFATKWNTTEDNNWTSSQIQEVLRLPGVKKAIVSANFASRQASSFKAPQSLVDKRKAAAAASGNPSHSPSSSGPPASPRGGPRDAHSSTSSPSSSRTTSSSVAPLSNSRSGSSAGSPSTGGGWSSAAAAPPPTPPPPPPPMPDKLLTDKDVTKTTSDASAGYGSAKELTNAVQKAGAGLKSAKKVEEKEMQTDPIVEPVNFEDLFKKLEDALKAKQGNGADEGVGTTPLHIAAKAGQDGVLTLLLESGEDVNAVDSNYNTPLHLAVSAGHEKMVAKLLAAGARPDMANADGEIPVRMAASRGDKAGMSMLKTINALSRSASSSKSSSSNGNGNESPVLSSSSGPAGGVSAAALAEWDNERARLNASLGFAQKALDAEKAARERAEASVKVYKEQENNTLQEFEDQMVKHGTQVEALFAEIENLRTQLATEKKRNASGGKGSSLSLSPPPSPLEEEKGLPGTLKQLDKYVSSLHSWRRAAERVDRGSSGLTVEEFAEMDLASVMDTLDKVSSKLHHEIKAIIKVVPTSSSPSSSSANGSRDSKDSSGGGSRSSRPSSKRSSLKMDEPPLEIVRKTSNRDLRRNRAERSRHHE
eukprot:TRINITY_DN762_c0_g1_i2.p1 TRINITY_DN762_c0_g1~~TRINITY_DN762_c0_g1_i2.p1  ORF type:complete len:721 (-),score=163.60 TRINITY_DN762_c0_g1_i2:114-2276(-)